MTRRSAASVAVPGAAMAMSAIGVEVVWAGIAAFAGASSSPPQAARGRAAVAATAVRARRVLSLIVSPWSVSSGQGWFAARPAAVRRKPAPNRLVRLCVWTADASPPPRRGRDPPPGVRRGGGDDRGRRPGRRVAAEIVLGDFTIEPSTIVVDPGSHTFRVVNEGEQTHALEIEGPEGEVETGDLAPGESGRPGCRSLRARRVRDLLPGGRPPGPGDGRGDHRQRRRRHDRGRADDDRRGLGLRLLSQARRERYSARTRMAVPPPGCSSRPSPPWGWPRPWTRCAVRASASSRAHDRGCTGSCGESGTAVRQLREAGVIGVLTYSDEDCRLHAVSLPDLEPVEAPSFEMYRPAVSNGGLGVADGDVVWSGLGYRFAQVLLSREELSRAILGGPAGADGGFRAVQAVSLADARLLVLAESGAALGERVVAVFDGPRARFAHLNWQADDAAGDSPQPAGPLLRDLPGRAPERSGVHPRRARRRAHGGLTARLGGRLVSRRAVDCSRRERRSLGVSERAPSGPGDPHPPGRPRPRLGRDRGRELSLTDRFASN